jgi:hypothetical protein
MKEMKYALKKRMAWLGAAPAAFLTWLNVAFADNQPTNITLPNPLGTQTFAQITANVLGFIFWDIATPLTVLMVLVGAFQLMTSAGEPEKISQGRKTIMYAAIGFAIALIASGAANILQSILNNT